MATMAVRPRIGASDLVYAVLTESSDYYGGTPTYGSVKAMCATGGTGTTPKSHLSKITVNPNGSGAILFADDGAALAAETIGKIDLDFEIADIYPQALAEILGHTYANGTIVEYATDQSPYIAIGFKTLRTGLDGSSLVYDYYWLYKGKMFKPSDTAQTKADSINFQKVVLKGMFVKLQADNSYRLRLRTDDPNAGSTLITNFFANVTLPTVDTGALSCTISQGTAGHAADVLFTFAKVGGGSFTVSATSISTQTAIVINNTDGDAVLAGTYSTPTTGTTSLVYFTPTTPITSTDKVTVVATNQISDNSGVHCTQAVKYLTWS